MKLVTWFSLSWFCFIVFALVEVVQGQQQQPQWTITERRKDVPFSPGLEIPFTLQGNAQDLNINTVGVTLPYGMFVQICPVQGCQSNNTYASFTIPPTDDSKSSFNLANALPIHMQGRIQVSANSTDNILHIWTAQFNPSPLGIFNYTLYIFPSISQLVLTNLFYTCIFTPDTSNKQDNTQLHALASGPSQDGVYNCKVPSFDVAVMPFGSGFTMQVAASGSLLQGQVILYTGAVVTSYTFSGCLNTDATFTGQFGLNLTYTCWFAPVGSTQPRHPKDSNTLVCPLPEDFKGDVSSISVYQNNPSSSATTPTTTTTTTTTVFYTPAFPPYELKECYDGDPLPVWVWFIILGESSVLALMLVMSLAGCVWFVKNVKRMNRMKQQEQEGYVALPTTPSEEKNTTTHT